MPLSSLIPHLEVFCTGCGKTLRGAGKQYLRGYARISQILPAEGSLALIAHLAHFFFAKDRLHMIARATGEGKSASAEAHTSLD